jgi:hypothetical protein
MGKLLSLPTKIKFAGDKLSSFFGITVSYEGKMFTFVANDIKFCLEFTNVRSKLECLSLASLSSIA